MTKDLGARANANRAVTSFDWITFLSRSAYTEKQQHNSSVQMETTRVVNGWDETIHFQNWKGFEKEIKATHTRSDPLCVQRRLTQNISMGFLKMSVIIDKGSRHDLIVEDFNRESLLLL